MDKAPTIRSRVWVFVLFLSIYLVSFGGHVYSWDEEMVHILLERIVEQKTFAMPTTDEAWVGNFERGIDAKQYSPYGLVPSLAQLPFNAIGKQLARLTEPRLQGFIERFPGSLVSPIASALSCMLVYSLAFQLYCSKRRSLVLTALFGLCTLVWPYAKMNYSEPLVSLFLLAAFYQLFMYGGDGNRWRLGSSGLLLGIAVATKVASAIFIPVYALYLLLVLRQRGLAKHMPQRPRALLSQLAIWALPVAICVALVLGYNYFRYGDLGETGYGPAVVLFAWERIPTGMYGLLLSPGKNLFIYALPTLLFAPALLAFGRQRRDEALAFGLVVLVNLVFFAGYIYWQGGVSWGPRFLTILMPYMVIPLGALFDWLNSRRVLRALCVVMLALWFINVQVPGMLIHCATSNKIGFYDPELIYIPRYTPLTFNLLRTATLARDWGRLLLDQAPPEAERYQGAPGEEYYRWLLFSPHRPEVPPFPSSQGPGPLYFDGPWFYEAEHYHAVDAWWWYWGWLGLPRGWILLVLIPLALIPISLWRLKQADAVPDYPARTRRVGHWLFLAIVLAWAAVSTWLLAQTLTNMQRQRVALRLGESIVLRSYDIDQRAKRPVDALDLMLYWQASTPIEMPYNVFVHFADDSGRVITQQDGWPAGGYAPTNAWEPEQVVRDAYCLKIPADTPPGIYRVLVGMYELESGMRLPITAPDGSPVGDYVELCQVHVR